MDVEPQDNEGRAKDGGPPPAQQHTVLFDGNCPICLGAVERLRAWDRDGALAFLPGGSPEARVRFPEIPPDALADALHMVAPDGRVWAGAEAVEELVGLLPGWRRLRWVFRIPLARPLAGWVYRRVAAARYRMLCQDHCGSG